MPDRERNGRPHIDLLVLSHLHKDYINGFQMLVNMIEPTIDRLIIPHYDDEDKLVVLAQAAHVGATTAELRRLHAVLDEPVGWFGARGVVQILAVAPGPPRGEPPPEPPPPLAEDGPPEGYRIVPWPDRLPDRGGERRRATEAYVRGDVAGTSPPDLRYVVLPPGSVLRVVPPERTVVHFVVVPCCTRSLPSSNQQRRHAFFIERVRQVLPRSVSGKPFSFRNDVEAEHVLDEIRKAFFDYAGRGHYAVNRLSVVCYIGADGEAWRSLDRHYWMERWCCFFCDERLRSRNQEPVAQWRGPRFVPSPTLGWFMTGDADLRRDPDWRTVLARHLRLPTVMQAPHHGESRSFPPDFPERVQTVFVTCKQRDRRRPGSSVVRRLSERRVPLVHVTDAPETMLVSLEWF